MGSPGLGCTLSDGRREKRCMPVELLEFPEFFQGGLSGQRGKSERHDEFKWSYDENADGLETIKLQS